MPDHPQKTPNDFYSVERKCKDCEFSTLSRDAFWKHRAEHEHSKDEAEVGAEDTKRMRKALVSIQSHGALSDNELSMIWTARVGLNPAALDLAPEHLRDVIRERFSDTGGSE